MDKIKVNTDALNKATLAIKDFKEQIIGAISKCETALKNEFGGIDDSFKKDLTDYIDKLHSLKNDIEAFETENAAAIKDRISRLSDYSKTSYRKRNI